MQFHSTHIEKMMHYSVEDMNDDRCSIFGENRLQTAWEQVCLLSLTKVNSYSNPPFSITP